MTKTCIVGIDLGTTNCCIATVSDGSVRVIPNRGQATTPSMVAVTEDGRCLVGHTAKRQAITNAEHTAYALKRLVGRNWGSAQVREASLLSPFSLVSGRDDATHVELRGKNFSLQELSSLILQDLKSAADEYFEDPVTKAVITVPAYFNDAQRQATRDAGEVAGLDVLGIINEPTAAALAFGYSRNEARTLAVYDLGGGTFDISVVRLDGRGSFDVLATGGDTTLGGEDLDNCIVTWLADTFEDKHDIDVRTDPVAQQRLKSAAEEAKLELSIRDQVEIELPFIATAPDGMGLHLSIRLPRAVYENLIADMVDRTILCCADVLQQANLGAAQVDDVLLVGGGSRTPLVRARVEAFFGRSPSQGINGDEAVAMGAALHANALATGDDRVNLNDVTPHALGLMGVGHSFLEVIPRNTRVPTDVSRPFSTSRDNQIELSLIVLQADSEAVAQHHRLGEFVLNGLRKAPRGEVTVDVSFAIDADGMVQVSARDMHTGSEQSIQVNARPGLTDEERKSMKDTWSNPGDRRSASEPAAQSDGLLEREITSMSRLLAQAEINATGHFDQRVVAQVRDALDNARKLTDATDSQQRVALQALVARRPTLKKIASR